MSEEIYLQRSAKCSLPRFSSEQAATNTARAEREKCDFTQPKEKELSENTHKKIELGPSRPLLTSASQLVHAFKRDFSSRHLGFFL